MSKSNGSSKKVGSSQIWWGFVPLSVLLVAILYTRNLSGDVWWHLMTGRWILEHRAFPGADPFFIYGHKRPCSLRMAV